MLSEVSRLSRKAAALRYFVLFVIDLKTRRIEIAGIAAYPDGRWMGQIAAYGLGRLRSPGELSLRALSDLRLCPTRRGAGCASRFRRGSHDSA
jgi:hypothetical protein